MLFLKLLCLGHFKFHADFFFLLSLLLFSKALFFLSYLLLIYYVFGYSSLCLKFSSRTFPVTWLPLLLGNTPQILTSVIPHIKPYLL